MRPSSSGRMRSRPPGPWSSRCWTTSSRSSSTSRGAGDRATQSASRRTSAAGTTRWAPPGTPEASPGGAVRELVPGVPVGNRGDHRPGEDHPAGIARGEEEAPPHGVEHLPRGGEERGEDAPDETTEEAQPHRGEAGDALPAVADLCLLYTSPSP